MTITLSYSLILILFLFGWSSSDTVNNRIKIPDWKHHIKDSPDILKIDSVLYTGWYFIKDTSTGYKRQLEKTNETYNIDPIPIVTATSFDKVTMFHEKDCYALLIWLDKKGSYTLNVAKQEFKGSKLAFILDNRLLRTQLVDDPQFAMVGDDVDPRVYGQMLALPCNSFSPEEMKNCIYGLKSIPHSD